MMPGIADVQLGAMLCAIPVELRLMIFEFAVKLDIAVTPRQITQHSNKFTWGDREQVPVYDHPGNCDYVFESQESERLAIVSLNLTCKQFYEELRDYPVFYRVNHFQFDVEDLVPYLAAITPERRDMIQNISLLGEGGGTKSRRTAALHKHALALLSQSRALRNVHLISRTISHYSSKPLRFSGADFKPSAVQQAVDFAGLDISGADRACGFCPIVSSTHTRFEVMRQKKLDMTMDYKLGTLKKELLPRYDAKGQLLWRVQEIRSIRRGSRGPKCEVKWWNAGSKDTVEWEDASSLMSQEGLELFRKFYDDCSQKFRRIAMSGLPKCDLEAELTRFTTIPVPDEIKALAMDLFATGKALQSRWRRLQRDYQRTQCRLEVYSRLAAAREGEASHSQKKRAIRSTQSDARPTKRTKLRRSE